jgi:hypothetical protein
MTTEHRYDCSTAEPFREDGLSGAAHGIPRL